MKITAVRNTDTADSAAHLDQMFRLRARVFSERLGWDVAVRDGREFDAFDDLGPTYILALTEAGDVAACARLLPATGPTMVATIFPELLAEGSFRPSGRIVESSRFCVDTTIADRGEGTLHQITRSMFAGIVEWCLISGYEEIVTATDVMVERILAKAGWPLNRLGPPRTIGRTLSVAGLLIADRNTFERLRPPGYESGFTAVNRTVASACA